MEFDYNTLRLEVYDKDIQKKLPQVSKVKSVSQKEFIYETLRLDLYNDEDENLVKANKKEKKTKSAIREALEVILIFLVIANVVLGMTMNVTVVGASMENTLFDNERMYVRRTLFWKNIQVNDLAVIDYSSRLNPLGEEKLIIKRIIAMPEQTFEIKDNLIYIDNLSLIHI